MKKKNLLTAISTIVLCALMLSTVAFAVATPTEKASTIKYILDNDGGHRVSDEEFYAKLGVTDKRTVGSVATFTNEQVQEAERPMLRFYLGMDGLYKLSEEQFQEAISETFSFSDIISRDGLTPLSIEGSQAASEVSEFVTNQTRAKGRWDINGSEIKDGIRKTYFMPDGSSFVVADGETILFSIEPNKVCWLTFGATGTKEFRDSAYVDKKKYFGVTIGTTTPGSYKFFAENTDNGFDVTVDGTIGIE